MGLPCLPLLPPTLFWENVLEKRLYFLRTQASGPFQLRMPPARQPLCPLTYKFFSMCLGLVVQKMDSAIHWINHYPVDRYEKNELRYPVDRDLFNG